MNWPGSIKKGTFTIYPANKGDEIARAGIQTLRDTVSLQAARQLLFVVMAHNAVLLWCGVE